MERRKSTSLMELIRKNGEHHERFSLLYVL